MPTIALDSTAGLADRLRTPVRTGQTRPLAWRSHQLGQLRAMLADNGPQLAAALYADLHKSEAESFAYEIDFTIREIDHLLAHLEQWLQPEPAAAQGYPAGTSAATRYDPLGVVLVIGTWNYPLQLLLAPVAGALAAGNTVVAKPSELAPATSALLATLLARYFTADTLVVVEGAAEETNALLAQRFDHIFFTGGGNVARIVMKAAAEHLTPVTLELGGKSPAFVDRAVDIAEVAARLARTKFANAGQTCVAPDYVLTDPDTARALEPALTAAITERYGPDAAASPEYARIVNQRHFERLSGLLRSGRTVTGGVVDPEQRYIAPTVLADVAPDAPVMTEEIFGPILPLIEVPDLDEAIEFINHRDTPLALYAFTESEVTKRRLATETFSGALNFGLPMAHLRDPDLPFGGVGASGMGNYHGRYSMETFSHRKAVLDVPLTP